MQVETLGILLTLGLLGCGMPDSPAVPTPDPATPRPSLATPTPKPSLLGDGKTVRETLGNQKMVLVLPQNYQSGQEKLPLVIFFHGYTMDENQVLERTTFPRAIAREGWLLASSSLAGPTHWGNPKALEMHDEMVDYLLQKYRVDPEKLFFVGFSMGGGTALLAGIQAKVKPRAIASSQGWTDLSELLNGQYGTPIQWAYNGYQMGNSNLVTQAEKLKGIPIYLEHGRFDSDVPPTQSEALHKAFEALEIPHTYRVFSGSHSESNIGVDEILKFFRLTFAPPQP